MMILGVAQEGSSAVQRAAATHSRLQQSVVASSYAATGSSRQLRLKDGLLLLPALMLLLYTHAAHSSQQ